MIHRAFRYRLYPTAEQERLLWQTAGVTRLVYNLALEQRRDYWRQAQRAGHRFNFVSQGHEVTRLRAEFGWIGDVSSDALTRALRDLDSAYAAFFAGRSGFPTPRKRGQHDSFRVRAASVRFKQGEARWAQVGLPKIGWVKVRNTRPLQGEIVNATVTHDALGWHISFACQIEHEAPANDLPAVGIDRGVANTLALSTGELLSTPCTAKLECRKKRAQRVLARRKRGSVRYRKQRQRLGRITAKIARVRADWRHKTTTDIARGYGQVVIEDLNTKGMTAAGRGKSGLNWSILEQGWGAFEACLAYKLEERGGTLTKVNPAYTSQECSACGTIDKASRESQSSYACRHCGFAAHADTNAAINILRRSTAPMLVEGSACAPVEARTDHALAA